MMREMSYRDKMILLIISVLIILAVGFFALIRPKYNALVEDKAIYADVKTEWDGIEAKKAQIPVLQDGIKKEYNSAKEIAGIFVNDIFQPVNDTFDNLKANYILDQYVQPVIDENNLKVQEFEMEGVKSQKLEYYFYQPDVLTYSLLESADVNGNYAEEVAELLKESTYLTEKQTVEIMTNTLTLQLNGKKADLMTFLNAMKEDEHAFNITAVEIADYTFGEGQTQTITEQQTNPDGTVTEVTRQVPVATNGEGESSISVGITFYNAKPVDDPYLGD